MGNYASPETRSIVDLCRLGEVKELEQQISEASLSCDEWCRGVLVAAKHGNTAILDFLLPKVEIQWEPQEIVSTLEMALNQSCQTKNLSVIHRLARERAPLGGALNIVAARGDLELVTMLLGEEHGPTPQQCYEAFKKTCTTGPFCLPVAQALVRDPKFELFFTSAPLLAVPSEHPFYLAWRQPEAFPVLVYLLTDGRFDSTIAKFQAVYLSALEIEDMFAELPLEVVWLILKSLFCVTFQAYCFRIPGIDDNFLALEGVD